MSARRTGSWLILALVLSAGFSCATAEGAGEAPPPDTADFAGRPSATAPPAWRRGQGWGWIWGADDQTGALNSMTAASRLAALALVTEGRVYDLGVTWSRESFQWPGHNKGEVITFRTPEGIARMGDLDFTLPAVNPAGVAWHSSAVFISDNVGTQIDGLGHLSTGEDDHVYNGYPETIAGGDFGVRRNSAVGIPPIVNRAVLIDVAGAKGVAALPGGTAIGPADLQQALALQGTELRPGDIALVRTGAAQFWGAVGADHDAFAAHDSAGINLAAARWLVEERGVLAVGSDTSGLEVAPAPPGSDTFVPVHQYLLIEQGVHILELHDLEALARDRVWEFCYVGTTNKIAGTTAGFALRPIALR
ncbi:MAG TPA: cyclase family protein [Planctomycetota bacterium]